MRLLGLALGLAACGAEPGGADDPAGATEPAASTGAGTTPASGSSPLDTGDAGPADDHGSSTGVADGPSTGADRSGTDDGATEDTGTSGEPPLPRDAVAVAVGYGTRRVRSEDGLVWTDFQEVNPEGGDDDDLLRGVGYGDGVFLAVGGAGNGFSMRSLDGGVTWQDEDHGATSFVSDAAWLPDGIFVAAGGNGLRMRSLDDGVSWQDATPYFAGHYRAIAAGGGVAVAVGHTYGDSTAGLTSTTVDGATWTTEQTGGAAYSGGSLAYGAGVFVARDDAGEVRVSTDGEDWGEPVLELHSAGAVIFADGAHVTAGDDAYFSSADGTRWTELPSPHVRDLAGFIDGHYLQLGWPATIAASEDLAAWDVVFDPGGSGLTDIAFGVPSR